MWSPLFLHSVVPTLCQVITKLVTKQTEKRHHLCPQRIQRLCVGNGADTQCLSGGSPAVIRHVVGALWRGSREEEACSLAVRKGCLRWKVGIDR